MIDPLLIAAGAIIGLLVGLTGMGGGALMTPILILLFGVPSLSAISSDLVVSLFMKPAGAIVHVVRRTVHWRLVGLLCAGSIPGALVGAYLIAAIPRALALDETQFNAMLKLVLGVVLLIATGALAVRAVLVDRRRVVIGESAPRPRVVPTIAVGVFAGIMVGMTSVGAGSVVIVALMLLYPGLAPSALVGTDLVQSIPLVGAAALGHVFFGEISLTLTASLLIGAVPGAFIGGQISSRVRSGVIRRILMALLLASALGLFAVPTVWIAVGAIALFVAAQLASLLGRRPGGRTTDAREDVASTERPS